MAKFSYMYRSIMLVALFGISACASYEYHHTSQVRINKTTQIDDDALLDVGIVVFDTGIDENDEDSITYGHLRSSEAVWFAHQLKKTLGDSNAWGSVYILPDDSVITDLKITGKIHESNGETVHIGVSVHDASGKPWWNNQEYVTQASAYSYHPEIENPHDPFQSLFNSIANDLTQYLQSYYNETQLAGLHKLSNIRFAQSIAPAAFADYTSTDDTGITHLHRIPSTNDPTYQRVSQIRARNDLFLDVVQDYYRNFSHKMSIPYQQWRKQSYHEVVRQRQLKKQASQEKWAGLGILAAGILASTSGNSSTAVSGHVGIAAGSLLFRKSYLTRDEALLHKETLIELGASLEAELEPGVVDLHDRTITLTGTVQDQLKEWHRILHRIYQLEENDWSETDE